MLALLPLFSTAETCITTADTPTTLTINGASIPGVASSCPVGSPTSGCAQCWKDYKIVADDDDYNLVFQVNATSDYANAIGIYLSEDLPALSERHDPAQFLDFDATSMIVIDGVRQYSIALAQCYIRRGQSYYLSVFGKNVVGSHSKPTVPYSIAVKKVPAKIPMNSTVIGQVCDGTPPPSVWTLSPAGEGGDEATSVVGSGPR